MLFPVPVGLMGRGWPWKCPSSASTPGHPQHNSGLWHLYLEEKPTTASLGPHPACLCFPPICLWVLHLKVPQSQSSVLSSCLISFPKCVCACPCREAVPPRCHHCLTQAKWGETLLLIPAGISPESEQEGFLPREGGKGCCVSPDEATCFKIPLQVRKRDLPLVAGSTTKLFALPPIGK